MPIPVRVAEDAGDALDHTSNRLAWFLAGAVIGTVATILYAPRRGRDTRQFLADKTQQGKDAVAGSTRDVVDAGRELFERGRKLVEDAADLFERGRRLVRGDSRADV